MAELKVQVLVDRKDADSQLDQLEKRIAEMEGNPINIPVNVGGNGADGLKSFNQEQEKATTGANRYTAAQNNAAKANQNVATSGKEATSVLGGLGDKASAYLQFTAMDWGARAIRNSADELKALDSAMVGVRKVTGATAGEMETLKQKSFEMAQTYGVLPSEYMEAVADFSRAGYRETADELAELQIKTQLVGDTNAEVARQMLLSVDAAYKYNGSAIALGNTLDGMNAIDNNFATSIEDMATGLGKVAPIASMAGVGIDELTASIGTISAATQRPGEEIATALRALFLNIMGDTKTEIEDGVTWTADQITGLRDLIVKYAPEVVAEAERMGTVINPMEAIGAMAQAYKDGTLNLEELMQMVTDIGGKLRAAQLTALIQNWDMYQDQLDTYRNAAGSTEKEIDNMTDSWDVKSKQLQASAAALFSDFFGSEEAKGGLDFLNTLVQGMDSGIGQAVIQAALLSTAAATAYSAFDKLFQLFSKPMDPAGWAAIAVGAISLLASTIQEVFPSYEKLKERTESAEANYQTEASKLSQIATELANVRDRMTELQNLSMPTLVEQAELENLREYARLLEQQEEVQKRRVAEAQKEAAMAAAEQMRAIEDYDAQTVQGEYEFAAQTGNISGLFSDLQNVNQLIAAYQLLKDKREEAYNAGDDEAFTQYNDLIPDVEAQITQNAADIIDFLATYEAYYDALVDKSQEAGQMITTEEAAFMKEYEEKAKTLEGIYKETNPAKYAEYYVDLVPEEAAAKVKEYTDALEKQAKELKEMADAAKDGSYEQKQYEQELASVTEEQKAFADATKEANERIGEVEGTQDAISLAEDLAATYGLTAEATDALVQQIRMLAQEAANAKGGEVKLDVDADKAEKEVKKAVDEIDEATNDEEYTIVVDADTDDADKKVDKTADETNAVTNEEDYTVSVDGDTSEADTAIDTLQTKLTELTGQTWTVNLQINQVGEVPAAGGGSQADGGVAKADGGKARASGTTLVGEIDPEIIVDRSAGMWRLAAYPQLTNLDTGDIVFNGEQTRNILAGQPTGFSQNVIGGKSYAMGAGQEATLLDKAGAKVSYVGGDLYAVNGNIVTGDQVLGYDQDATNTAKKSSGGGGGGGSGSGGSDKDEREPIDIVEEWFDYYMEKMQIAIDALSYKLDQLDYELEGIIHPLEETIEDYERLSGAIDRQIELLERQRKAMIDPIQDEIDALEKAKDIEDEQLELAEKKLAVEEAKAELQNAQNERNIRYFNAEKGQWEWMADQGRVADAEEAVKDAEKDLADFEYEMYIRSLERQIEDIESVFDDKIEELEKEQMVYDDAIYDLEQKVDLITDKYEDRMYPIEREQGALELEKQGMELEWANATYPYHEPEDSLSKALGKLDGTAEEKAAISDALSKAEGMGNDSYNGIGDIYYGESGSAVSSKGAYTKVTTPKTTEEMYNELLAEMGVRFGASESSSTGIGNVTTTSNATVVDNSGQTIINGITIKGDAESMSLADMLDDAGIHVQRKSR